MRITRQQYEELLSRLQANRQSKYKAQKAAYGNLVFDSKAELHRYRELELMQQAGEIRYLRYHDIRFRLGVSDTGKPVFYTPDYTYQDARTGQLVAEEVKGVRVRDWPVRAAMFRQKFPEWKLVVWKG